LRGAAVPIQILSSPGAANDTARDLERAVAAAFPDARVEVHANSPGHFEIRVVSASFAHQSRVVQQQRVYAAIAHLMKGDSAPVHAIDRLITDLA
jgi:acid stress-induced BolA-like protein IbaG/YrbA